MCLGVFARFQVVGELVAGRDVSRIARDGSHQTRRDDTNLSQQPAGVLHLMLLKALRVSCARHQVEGDSLGQGLRLDRENDVLKAFPFFSSL